MHHCLVAPYIDMTKAQLQCQLLVLYEGYKLILSINRKHFSLFCHVVNVQEHCIVTLVVSAGNAGYSECIGSGNILAPGLSDNCAPKSGGGRIWRFICPYGYDLRTNELLASVE